ncbi:EAL domain-containing protein [uncultured Sphaerochaeta sp.]|uniref:EAL domain-containing protein n=1 Tax=uncultured Sphaerochaeta sp. TaxID=886478 RepID=UPI0029CA0159|nr:EAL domain-containing protein [uncultured Sphaerochaeta sp.]
MMFTPTILHDTGPRTLLLVNLSPIHNLTLHHGFSYAEQILSEVTLKLQALACKQIQTTIMFTRYHLFYVREQSPKFYHELTTCLDQVLSREGIGWGIGLVEFEEIQEEELEELFRNVLVASETALETESKFCFFTQEMQKQDKRRNTILAELFAAIQEQAMEKIHLQYQPIASLETNEISELEVLCRFQSDTYGIVWPDEFIPLSEMSRQIIPLGTMIFQKAFTFCKVLKERVTDSLRLSINVSVVQLLYPDFLSNLYSLMDLYEVDPSSLVLEITESCIIPNYHAMNALFSDIQSHGITLAVDDFGTGYSSLAHEEQLSLEVLKIDKIFIDALSSLPEERALVQDIISMGHRLGRTIIAEGVETAEQRERLQCYGCDKIQGYLVSRPLDADEILQFLAEKDLVTENVG